jgi:hypothetical protein
MPFIAKSHIPRGGLPGRHLPRLRDPRDQLAVLAGILLRQQDARLFGLLR